MTTSTNFIEVETKETVDADPAESKFHYACVKCSSVALATNGSMVLRPPMEPMADQKQYFVDYLYCGKCDILENAKDMEFNKQVCIRDPEQPSEEARRKFTKRIIDDIFS